MTLSSLDLVLFFVASSGIGFALLLSFLLWKKDPIAPYSNQILALLLACLSLRIMKSVFYNFLELPLWIRNFGLAFNLAIGPLLYFYGRSFVKATIPKIKRVFPHFLPSLAFFIGAWWIPNGEANSFWYIGYSFILLQGFYYLGWCAYLWSSKLKIMADRRSKWFLFLIVGIGIIWMVYGLIFIKILPVYMAGALSFSVLILLTGKWMLTNKPFVQELFYTKYKASRLAGDEGSQLFRSATLMVLEEALFLEANYPIAALAEKLNISAKQLSQAINQEGACNYSYFMNAFRVKHAQQLLQDEQHRKQKLFFIALESGFNSLSSFNASFKAHTGVTPSAFRKKVRLEAS